ncbi:MAG: hypothetical protein GXO49_04110 [Chlorobi bacterium]|nr:hypothetical protein [Chlorobiota bacterium]
MLKIETRNIKIAAGENGDTLDITFPGDYNVIGVMYVHKKGDLQKDIDCEFMMSNGSNIVGPIDINALAKGDDGFKPKTAFPFPPGISSNSGVRLKVTSEEMDEDFKGQFIFILTEKGKAIGANNEIVDVTNMC